MRYIFSDESFCYLCTLVLFTEINNAEIVSYLNSILYYKSSINYNLSDPRLFYYYIVLF